VIIITSIPGRTRSGNSSSGAPSQPFGGMTLAGSTSTSASASAAAATRWDSSKSAYVLVLRQNVDGQIADRRNVDLQIATVKMSTT
jgi:hypothetical protein